MEDWLSDNIFKWAKLITTLVLVISLMLLPIAFLFGYTANTIRYMQEQTLDENHQPTESSDIADE